MASKHVLGWLKKGWTAFVDPQKEQRLKGYVSAIHKDIASKREQFSLEAISSELDMGDETEEACLLVYEKFVLKAWSDSALTESEKKNLRLIARLLEIENSAGEELIQKKGVEVFTEELSKAFADGVLDDSEYARLQQIAHAIGTTPGRLIQSQFSEEGEALVRNLFIRAWENGEFGPEEWNRIQSILQRIGMSEAEFRLPVSPSAQRFVEHVLADAKNDEVITRDEESILEWLLKTVILDKGFAEYVRSEVATTKRFANLRKGILPSIRQPEGIPLSAGEIAHFSANTSFTQIKRRGGEVVRDKMSGIGVVTDDRFVFVSSGKSLQVIHSKILGYRRRPTGVEIQCPGVASGLYEFTSDIESGIEIWIAAIGKARQTITAPAGQEQNSRHIPRDIRQRVWSRYGGRCAECNSDQYLEYDHIIPVAKGGGNSDNNVQLLCRRCNLTKSDKI